MNPLFENPVADLTPDLLNAFEPSVERARFLDGRMRRRLAESLRYIQAEGAGVLDLSGEQFSGFLERLERHPVSPLAFSYYCDLVLAIEKEDFDQAKALVNQLVLLSSPRDSTRVIDLGDPVTDRASERYARFVEAEQEGPAFEVFPPSHQASASCRGQIADAFALMDAGDPALAGEIRALLREIILAAGTLDPKAMTFDGASSFMLWGAILINANRSDGTIGMVQMLAHESSHNLLFGLTVDGPLIENGHEERYASPLRKDPRPLEGIYHATFVLARMHRALQTLLASGVLAADARETALRDLQGTRTLFFQGMETISRHGRLTSAGEMILTGAVVHMEAGEGRSSGTKPN